MGKRKVRNDHLTKRRWRTRKTARLQREAPRSTSIKKNKKEKIKKKNKIMVNTYL
jgi:hypothetical protein